MLKEAELQKYQPEVIKEYREFCMLADAENPELTNAWTISNNIFLDQFLETLTANGCRRWEKILDITAMATDPLKVRRFRIQSKINEILPYTYRRLEQILDTICGIGGYEMKLLHKEYTLIIKIELTNRKEYDYIQATMARLVPANLLLKISIRYNQHFKLAKYRHRELSSYTHQEIREMVLPMV